MKQFVDGEPPRRQTLRVMQAEEIIEHLAVGRNAVGPEILAHECTRVPEHFFEKRYPHIGRLFPDPVLVAKDYFKRTGFFPIMHVLGIRRALTEQHPWLPGAVLKAFEQAKQLAVAELADTAVAKVTLPFVEEMLGDARAFMGEDFWSYGVAPNRKVLDYFLGQHHAQGLSSRRLSVDELFHPATYETFKV